MFSDEFCEISKNTFSYSTPPVAASAYGMIFLSSINSIIGESKLFCILYPCLKYSNVSIAANIGSYSK